MADATNPVFLVDATSDPVVVRIDGRASFQNSGCLRDFVHEMLRQGRRRFVLDMERCTGMDSTFLGVLAGAALDLRKGPEGGSLVIVRAAGRNQELIRNLGLHRLLILDTTAPGVTGAAKPLPISCRTHSEEETARLVLEAHESLIAADEANREKFQDVLAFLRNSVEQK